MRQKGIAILIALVAAGVLSGSAQAAVVNPVINWSPTVAFAFEPNFVMPHQSVAGNSLTIVGEVDLAFQDPLAGNNPVNTPGVEYTFVFDQLVSQGSVFVEQGNFDIYRTNYNTGRFRLFQDTTPDRDFGTNPPNVTSPSTFEDGVLLLEGTVHNFRTVSNAWVPNNNGGSYTADLIFTGGSQLPIVRANVCPNAAGFEGYLLGVWQRGLTGTPTGYIRACDGKIDMFPCPVPAESSTWGRIKSLYNQ